jgi:hypothetical protein
VHQGEDLESAGAPASIVPRIQLDRQSLTWQRVPLAVISCVPPPRSGAASVIVGNKLYMFGVRPKSMLVTKSRIDPKHSVHLLFFIGLRWRNGKAG